MRFSINTITLALITSSVIFTDVLAAPHRLSGSKKLTRDVDTQQSSLNETQIDFLIKFLNKAGSDAVDSGNTSAVLGNAIHVATALADGASNGLTAVKRQHEGEDADAGDLGSLCQFFKEFCDFAR